MTTTINTATPEMETSSTADIAASVRQYQPDPARISAVVERLRPSKVEADDQVYYEGTNDGRIWAEESATALELDRLASSGGMFAPMWDHGLSAYSNAERFFSVICPEQRRKRKAAREFWAVSIGQWKMPTNAYVIGFAAGAMEVWNFVRAQL